MWPQNTFIQFYKQVEDSTELLVQQSMSRKHLIELDVLSKDATSSLVIDKLEMRICWYI